MEDLPYVIQISQDDLTILIESDYCDWTMQFEVYDGLTENAFEGIESLECPAEHSS